MGLPETYLRRGHFPGITFDEKGNSLPPSLRRKGLCWSTIRVEFEAEGNVEGLGVEIVRPENRNSGCLSSRHGFDNQTHTEVIVSIDEE